MNIEWKPVFGAISFAVAAALAGVPATAQQTLEELEAAANAEGQLLIYSANQDVEMQTKLEAFEKAYPGIDAQYIRLPSSKAFARFVAEHEAGADQADMMTTGSTALYQTNPELFIELGKDNLPGYEDAGLIIQPENNHYVVFQSDVQVGAYNTNAVSEADLAAHLDSWEGLADPFWKGKIALVDPRNSANQLSFLLGLQERYGDEWMKKFAANEPQIVATGSAASQQVAAGAFDLLVPTVPAQSAAVRAQGAPLGLYLPKGFVHVPAQGAAISVKAAHPNAALLFVNWLIGKEAQAIQCKLGGVPNVIVGGDCTTTLPEEVSIGRDVIPSEEGAAVYKLINLQP